MQIITTTFPAHQFLLLWEILRVINLDEIWAALGSADA